MSLENQKEIARKEYFYAKNRYLDKPTKENWVILCDAKRKCMLLGAVV